MRVMLTRPRADSERLAKELQARGNVVVIEPMLNIVPQGLIPPLDDVAALIVTSANSIRTFAAACDRRDLIVYAVGDATALVASEVGFTAVESAQGDAVALEAHITAQVKPGAGSLLHIQGRDVTGELDESLISKGYNVRSAVMYRAETANELSQEARDLLVSRNIDVILFFSPRTVKTFVRLVSEAGLADRCDTIIAICLSAAVAEAGSALIWSGVHIAATPDRAAMLQLCDAVQESGQT